MKLVEFDYTKANGKKSQRAVLVVHEPSELLAGIDVSELDAECLADFLQDYRQVKNREHEAMMQVIHKHDLKHNFRQFYPDRMQNAETTLV